MSKKRNSLSLIYKISYIIIALVIVGAIVVGVYATTTTGFVTPVNPGHNSSQVFISVGNKTVTLQNAIDYGYLLGINNSVVPISSTPASSPYETASQVLITFKGQAMTLQEAINTSVFINNALQVGYHYTTVLPAGGDYGLNTNINTTTGVITLQNAINTGLTLLSTACLSGFVCPQGQKIGGSCYPQGNNGLCMNMGTITSSATCVGYSFSTAGTSCSADGSLSCNGNGQCVGWSGYGCGGCPFGTSSASGYNCCSGSSANNVGLLSYCSYTHSCNCAVSGSCSTCTDQYSWTMKPAASGNNYGSCAAPTYNGNSNSNGGHSSSPPSDTGNGGGDTGGNSGGGSTVSGVGSDGPGDGTASA